MTTLLAFDTSGPWVAAQLSHDGTVHTDVVDMKRGQAETLLPQLEGLLAQAGIGWADLSRIGVGVGPGNFTGIRISVAAARGLALGLDIPAIGISGLDALANQGAPAVLPAPRGQSYRIVDGEIVISEVEAPTIDPAQLVAGIAACAAVHSLPAPRPTPLYVRPADAAPPSDPAPVILDA